MFDLKKFRKDNKLTQDQLANYLGCKQAFISQIERGEGTIPDRFISKIKVDGIYKISESKKEELIIENLDNTNTIMLLPISAIGGKLNDFLVSVKESDCERIISPIKGADFAMTVAGDSMSPEYPNGSQIFIKKINEKDFIEWGKVYVLDTSNGTVIKIVNRSETEGYIKCTAINIDQKRYEPFEIPLTSVFGMYRVMLCMSIK